MKRILALSTTALFVAGAVHAATERDLDAHVHGGARLDLAIEGQQIYINLESPWANLVGFEHEPSTDEQRAAVDEALHELEHGDELFGLSGTECVLAQADIESSMEYGAHDDHDEEGHDDHDHDEEHADHDHDDHDHEEEHADHDDHDHEEEHAEHEHDEHDHEEEHAEHDHDHDEEHADHDDHDHDHDHAEGESHSSVMASYVFDCADAAEVETLTVRLFDVWGGFDDIDVQLAGPGGQGAAELEPGASEVDLSTIR